MQRRLIGLAAAMLAVGTACAGVGGQDGAGGGGAAGELRVFGDDPVSLDPAVMSDTNSAEYVMEVFGGLVTLDRRLRIQPDIAERWEISPDGKTYTFKLRPDAKFHDGKVVKASDFVYSIERAADPKTNSHTADTYLGDIRGVLDKLAGRAQQVAGVKAPDDSTVQLEIDAPKAYFLAKLQYPTAFVVDKENVERGGRTWMEKPNGTGPFKLVEWNKGTRIILEANPNYHLGAPRVQRVRFNIAGGNAMTMYENDEIDITPIGLADIERVEEATHPLNKQYVIGRTLDVWYVGFNNEMPPFDDVKVRQAFAMALDNEKIIQVVLRNKVIKANGVIPPDMPGFNPNLRSHRFDPDQAKRLLRESKYGGNLPAITLTVPGSATTVGPRTEAMIEQWKTNLGVEVRPQIVEWATFLGDVKRNPAQNKKAKYQMWELGWSADYPDPQDFVEVLLASYSLENNGAYKNAEVDALTRRAQTEMDDNRRFQLYQQAEQIAMNEVALLPLFHSQTYQLVKPWVKGWQPVPMSIQQYRYVSIER